MEEIIAAQSLMRVFMMGLINGCPHEDNIASCLAFDIRKLPISEKIAWLKSLSDDECRKISLQHLECCKEKCVQQSNTVAL